MCSRLAVLATLLALPSCGIHLGSWRSPAVWVEETETFDFSSAGLDGLEVRTHNGTLVVQGGAPDERVVAQVKKRAGGLTEIDAQDCLAAITVFHTVKGDTCHIGWDWTQPRQDGWGAEVSFEIQAPANLSTTLATHNGSVKVGGGEGKAHLRTHNGKIEFQGGGADLYAQTHNGSIEVQSAASSLEIRTHNGRIKATLERQGTVHGAVRTHNGSITIDCGEGVDCMVSGTTHNGGFRIDGMSSVVIDDNTMRGTLGSGSGSLEVRTHNGPIRIQAVDRDEVQ